MINNKNFICETSRIKDGNMSFKYGEKQEVIHNRKTFLEKYNLSLEDCVEMKVEHGEKITIVDFSNKNSVQNLFIRTEALITKEKNLVLFLKTADCLPVSLYDTENKVIALVHLGWKPTHNKLIGKVVEKMKKEFGSNPKKITVNVGPGIHKESYIKESNDLILKKFPEWEHFLVDIPSGKTQIDIVGYNKQQMLNSGILEENISIDITNTATSSEYFSHYRSARNNEPEGRFVTVLALV